LQQKLVTVAIMNSCYTSIRGESRKTMVQIYELFLANSSEKFCSKISNCTCRTLTPGHDPVQKVTLVPRGQARGLTWFIPSDDPTLISKQQLFARIVGGLGGRAAEEIIFGEPEVTTGAAGDLQQITSLAKQVSYNHIIFPCSIVSLISHFYFGGDECYKCLF